MLHRIDDEAYTREEQRYRQQLTHRRSAPQETELSIRLAEKLADRARERVADSKASDDQSRSLQSACAHEHRQHCKQHQTFECRLIELARMSRHRAAAWENHRPVDVCGSSPQFPVDEIGNAAEKQSDRSNGASAGAQRKHREAAQTRDRR